MSIVAVEKFLLAPPGLEGVASSDNDVNLSAADHRIAHVFTVTKSGILDKFEFAINPVGATVDNASVIRVSFRAVVAATGEPAGAIDQYRDILGSAISPGIWLSPGLMTSDGTDSGVKRTVTRGDLMCIVIEYQTFTASDNLAVSVARGRVTGASLGPSCNVFPYELSQSGGSWDKSAVIDGPVMFALKYADGTYGRPIAPGQGGTLTKIEGNTFNAASTPDEKGNRFVLPFPVRVTGAVVRVSPAAGADFEVVLIDTDGSAELEAVAVDAEHGTVTSSANPNPLFVPFAAQHELAIGTYRLTVRPTTANVLRVASVTVDAAAIMESVYNLNWFGTSRANLGAWTEEDTRLYLFGLVVDGLEEGSGAAGGGGGGGFSDRSFVRGMIS